MPRGNHSPPTLEGRTPRQSQNFAWRDQTAENHPGRGRSAPPKSSEPRSRMPRKSYNPTAPARIAEILKRLDERYPNVKCALHHNSAWELLVATILSAQCTDVRVNMVTPILFKKYPTPAHFAALQPEELEDRHPLHRILPQQVEVSRRSRPQDHQRLWRRSSAHHGRAADHPGRGPQDRQRGSGIVVWNRRRRSG